MTKDLTINQTPEGYFAIYCNVCGKHVEAIGWERPVHTVRSWDTHRDRFVPTGEVIVTVSCHGETITVSNWDRD